MADELNTSIPPTTSTNPTPAPEPKADARFTEEDLQKAVEARLARERSQQEARTAKEREAAEQAQLAARQEWEELAKRHEQSVADMTPQLETAKQRYESLAERNNRQIDAAIKDWPAEIRKLVPGGDDVAARLDAYEAARAIHDKYVAGPATPRPAGNGPNPRPQVNPSGASIEDEMRKDARYQRI